MKAGSESNTWSSRNFAVLAVACLCAVVTPSLADIMYVVDHYDGTVLKYTMDGVGSVFASGLSSPTGVTTDPAGNVYVVNQNTGSLTTIMKFTPGGVGSVFATIGNGMGGFFGLACDSKGDIYAASVHNTIMKFTPSGVGSVFASSLSSPLSLAFDSADNLYATYPGNNTIMEFTPGGVGSVFADSSSGLRGPLGLALDQAGNVYAANGFEDQISILKYTPNGVGSVFTSPQYGLAYGLACDSAGNVFAADQIGYQIIEYTSGGARSIFADCRQPLFIAIQIPEPSTFALAGLGAAALMIGRRRR